MACDLKVLSADFEFNRTSHPNVHLVSVSLRPYEIYWQKQEGDTGRIYPKGETETTWLVDDKESQAALKDRIQGFIDQGYVILSFGGIAEGRSLHALGFEACTYPLFDLYVLWMQLKHTWHRFMYGRYVNKWGELSTSEPPSYDIRGQKIKGDNTQTLNSLSAAVAHLLGRIIDSKHKDMMRNLIISDPKEFTAEQRAAILRYNATDILYLPEILLKMMDAYCEVTGIPYEDALKVMLQHGEYVSCLAKEEDNGIDLDLERTYNLSHNYEKAKDTLIESLVEMYPFYERGPVSKGCLKGEWVKKKINFENYLKEKGLYDTWPRTPPSDTYPNGQLKADEDTIEELEGGYPELKMLRQVSKSVNQMGWFNGDKEGDLTRYIGPDGKIRTWLAPFGTLTGRNAPKPSKGYIPAMAKWIRSLNNPNEGEVLIEPDWSSQEFLIAASLSEDPMMLEAYDSGDPYVFFMKKAGAIPEDANQDWIKKPDKAPPELRKVFEEYSETRDLGKATVLGLQFQMGKPKLHLKLKADTGKDIDRETSDRLHDFHHRLFKVYWAWVKRVVQDYHREKVIILQDGWCLLPDNESDTSTGNEPVQGTGACIFRDATRRATKKGLTISFGLHDAIRIRSKVENKERDTAEILECMRLAVAKYLKHPIRNEYKVIEHGVPYVEKAAKAIYEKMRPYLETRMDTDLEVSQRIYANLLEPLDK